MLHVFFLLSVLMFVTIVALHTLLPPTAISQSISDEHYCVNAITSSQMHFLLPDSVSCCHLSWLSSGLLLNEIKKCTASLLGWPWLSYESSHLLYHRLTSPTTENESSIMPNNWSVQQLKKCLPLISIPLVIYDINRFSLVCIEKLECM